MSRKITKAAAVAVAATFLLAACGDSSSTQPAAQSTAASVASGVTSIETSDGETLAGEIFGTGTTGVVLAHMRGANKETWFDFAATLADNGYSALAFDFRGYGDSTGNRDSNLDVDITAAVAKLKDSGVDTVFVFGASMGATATVVVASQLDLAGVVSLSGPASFGGLDALAAAGNLDEPALFIAAQSDQPYYGHAEQLATAAGNSRIEFTGGQHGTNIFRDQADLLSEILLDFIAANA